MTNPNPTVLTEAAYTALTRQRPPKSRSDKYLTVFIYDAAMTLLGGLALMLLVPLAHEHLGTPAAYPGYWPCVALVLLTDLVVQALRPMPKGDDR